MTTKMIQDSDDSKIKFRRIMIEDNTDLAYVDKILPPMFVLIL